MTNQDRINPEDLSNLNTPHKEELSTSECLMVSRIAEQTLITANNIYKEGMNHGAH